MPRPFDEGHAVILFLGPLGHGLQRLDDRRREPFPFEPLKGRSIAVFKDILEFRLDAIRAPAAKPGESCLEELTSIKGIKLRQGEGSRQVGGRLYVGANMVANQPTVSFCTLRWSSDIEPAPNKSNENCSTPVA
jgi:hypothetical protein